MLQQLLHARGTFDVRTLTTIFFVPGALRTWFRLMYQAYGSYSTLGGTFQRGVETPSSDVYLELMLSSVFFGSACPTFVFFLVASCAVRSALRVCLPTIFCGCALMQLTVAVPASSYWCG